MPKGTNNQLKLHVRLRLQYRVDTIVYKCNTCNKSWYPF